MCGFDVFIRSFHLFYLSPRARVCVGVTARLGARVPLLTR